MLLIFYYFQLFLLLQSSQVKIPFPFYITITNQAASQSSLPMMENEFQIFLNLTYSYPKNLIIELCLPVEFQSKSFPRSQLIYYQASQRYQIRLFNNSNNSLISSSILNISDAKIYFICKEELKVEYITQMTIILTDLLGIGTGKTGYFALYVYERPNNLPDKLIAYSTHVNKIFISNGTRDLMDFQINNDPLNYVYYKNDTLSSSFPERRGLNLFDFNMTLQYNQFQNSLVFNNTRYAYIMWSEALTLSFTFYNFYCAASKNPYNQTIISICPNCPDVNKTFSTFPAVVFNGNIMTIDLESSNLSNFQFSSLEVNIKNLYISMDHRLDLYTNQYFYDVINSDILYDKMSQMQTMIAATLKYNNNNFTMENKTTTFNTSTYEIRNSTIQDGDINLNNMQDFSLDFSENNYTSDLNAMNLTGTINISRYWNTLTVKFDIESNLTIETQIYYGYTLNTYKKLIDVNNSYFPAQNNTNPYFMENFCRKSNERSVFYNYKSVSCDFTVISLQGLMNISLFENYICIYCEYANDQQLNVHFINEEFIVNETTFFNDSVVLSFNLMMAGMEFYGDNITINWIGGYILKQTFLTSYMLTRGNVFQKYMDYDFMRFNQIHDIPILTNFSANLTFIANSSCFYPALLCDYYIGNLNLIDNTINPANVIYLYFPINFNLSAFSFDFESYSQIQGAKIIKITPKVSISNVSSLHFQVTNPPFDDNPIEIYVSIRNSNIPLQILTLNTIKQFFALTNVNFTSEVLDSLQFSDYNISFTLANNSQISRILISMEGYFNLTYFYKPNFFMIEIYENNTKIAPNFDFNITFIKNFMQFYIIFYSEYYLSQGIYNILLVNIKNSFQNRPSYVNLSLSNSKGKIFYNKILIYQNITKNPNNIKGNSYLVISNPVLTQSSQYIFSILLATRSFTPSIFRFLLPLNSPFLEFRNRQASKLMEFNWNYIINNQTFNQSISIITGFSKLEIEIWPQPDFSSMDFLQINISTVFSNPISLNETLEFLLDVINLGTNMITQQFIINNLNFTSYLYTIEAFIQDYLVIQSFNFTDFLIGLNIFEDWNPNYLKIQITFPMNFTINSFDSCRIVWSSKSMGNVEIPMTFYIETDDINDYVSLVLMNNETLFINYSDYYIRIYDVFTPKIINEQFCLFIILKSLDGLESSNNQTICTENLIKFNESVNYFNSTLRIQEPIINFFTIYHFTLQINFPLYKTSQFLISFNSDATFLQNYTSYVDCSLESPSLTFLLTLKCLKFNASAILIQEFLDQNYPLQSNPFIINLYLFKIKNPATFSFSYNIGLLFLENYDFLSMNNLTYLTLYTNEPKYLSYGFTATPANHAEISFLTFSMNITDNDILALLGIQKNRLVDLNLELVSPQQPISFVLPIEMTCQIMDATATVTMKSIYCYYDTNLDRVIVKNFQIDDFMRNYTLMMQYLINFIYDPFQTLDMSYNLMIKNGSNYVFFVMELQLTIENQYQPVNFIDLISLYKINEQSYITGNEKVFVFTLNLIFVLNRPWCGRFNHSLYLIINTAIDLSNVQCNFLGLDLDPSIEDNEIICNQTTKFLYLRLMKIGGTFLNYVMNNMLVISLSNVIYRQTLNSQVNSSNLTGFDVYIFDGQMRIMQSTLYSQNNYLIFDMNE